MEANELYQIHEVSLTFSEPLTPLQTVKKLVIHHTEEIGWDIFKTHDFHLNVRHWSGIGYNFFIDGNIEHDGFIFKARGLMEGAHTLGYNNDTIGICLSGNFDKNLPTDKQMMSLKWLCKKLINEFGLRPTDIVGHRELGACKTCPGRNFDMDEFRRSM